MSIVKDLLFVILFILLIYYLKKNNSCRQELFNQRENFIKTLSHDLRVSTLAQIRGLDLLKKNDNSDLVYEIDESCKYSLDMINVLLNTYRYENGEQILNYETFNLNEIITNCSNVLASKLKEKNLELFFNINTSAFVEADKIELGKMFMYILSTTVFYSVRNNKIAIFVKKNSKYWEISITYSGKSLSEEECRRMFSNNSRFSTVGHGLKMYFCKKVIEFHGGNIYVRNLDDNINSFIFNLPIEKKQNSIKPILNPKFQPFRL